MKKILILSMSCQQPFFTHEIEVIKDTWGKDLGSNIDFMYYDGGYENTTLKDDHLMISSDDDIYGTFTKTIIAFKYLLDNGILDKYDYVFRTNTSTYVNVNLLSELCESLTDEDSVYGSDIYLLYSTKLLYLRGNGILYTSEQIEKIVKLYDSNNKIKMVDDEGLGLLTNIIGNFRKNYIRGLPFAKYKCINDNSDLFNPDIFCNCVTIQIRSYTNRLDEEKHYLELDKLIRENTVKPNLDAIKEYINNPLIYLGLTLGYITYDEFCEKSVNDNFFIKLDSENSRFPNYVESKRNFYNFIKMLKK